jgi:hypothetical protein
MSNKAKNLYFEAKQPAFLRRLRGEADAVVANPSRPVNPDLRKRAIKTSDEDDEPTYVLEESGSTISKAEYDALVSSKETAPRAEAAGEDAANPKSAEVSQLSTKPVESSGGKSAAAIGLNSKKRKATQVVTEDSVREANAESSAKPASRPPTVRPKKKSKAIKLSFGEDGDGGET